MTIFLGKMIVTGSMSGIGWNYLLFCICVPGWIWCDSWHSSQFVKVKLTEPANWLIFLLIIIPRIQIPEEPYFYCITM